ncbi:MAG: DoxX family protein, partial [Longimicrobiales bacterium]
MIDVRTNRWEDTALNVLRIFTGLLFMQHGAQKLFGWLEGQQAGELLMQVAGVLEFFGGLLIVLGLLTRPLALLLAAEMVIAYFMVHLPQGFWPIQNQGELALLYLFIYLYLSARGAGS